MVLDPVWGLGSPALVAIITSLGLLAAEGYGISEDEQRVLTSLGHATTVLFVLVCSAPPDARPTVRNPVTPTELARPPCPSPRSSPTPRAG